MTRPLAEKTIADLGAMAERNRINRAELDLIRSELRYRSTDKALLLARQVNKHLAAIDTASSPSVPDGLGERLEALSRLAAVDWNSAAALSAYHKRAQTFPGDSAEEFTARIAARLRELAGNAVKSAPSAQSMPITAPIARRGRLPLSLEIIAERVQADWNIASALRLYRDRLGKMTDPDATALRKQVLVRLAELERTSTIGTVRATQPSPPPSPPRASALPDFLMQPVRPAPMPTPPREPKP